MRTCWPRAAWLVLAVGCGDGPQITDGDGGSACLPACFTAALETCQPAGACTLEGESPMAGTFTGRICFANGVKTRISGQMSGTENSSRVEVEQNGSLCRSIESRESAASISFVVKDPGGQTAVTATITSFPGMTITCAGGASVEVDRRTDCGRRALGLLSGQGTTNAPASCTAGACK